MVIFSFFITISIYSNEIEKANYLDITIAGDIMAHNVNYRMKDYNKIYTDILNITQNDDLTFCNLETPVDGTIPYETYPTFNVQPPYLQAAVDAGFEVFSLANNHTNDQNGHGITETYKNFDTLRNNLEYKVYFSGIRENKNVKFSYELIEIKGWKILFCGITECINAYHDMELIDYVPPTTKQRKAYLSFLSELRAENPCDLFLVAVHTAEPEYVRTVSDERKAFFRQVLDAGVDIVWANHAHIIKDRKFIFDTENQRHKMIMYANGNTISGQRTAPDFKSKNPIGERDNTGDGLLYQVIFSKEEKNGKTAITIKKATPHFITTYINTANEYVIKLLNKDFVDYLYDVPRTNWAEYIKRRIKINNRETKDLIVWQ